MFGKTFTKDETDQASILKDSDSILLFYVVADRVDTAVKMHRRIRAHKIDEYIHRVPRLLQHIASYHCRLFNWPLSLGTLVSLVILMALDFNRVGLNGASRDL